MPNFFKNLNIFKSIYPFISKTFNSEHRNHISNARNSISGALSHARVWKKTAWVLNVAKWKRPILRKYLSDYNLIFLALSDDIYEKERRILFSLRPIFIVWGRTTSESILKFSQEHGIPIHHIEDGFFRSIGLGANHVLPYSICYDTSGLYYDSSQTSDLEVLLQTYPFDQNPHLLEEANTCIAEIRNSKLSKYNEGRTDLASFIYGPKVRTRILVIGQVEDDQSLLYGSQKIMNNAELIHMAARENPDAQIIYKQHPDVMSGCRKEISNTSELAHLAEILQVNVTLVDALHGVDRVYTLTSLAGFEALMNGVAVTTVGAPFYSGWGLTDDRQKTPRRTRKLTIEQIFAAAYILYPKYMDPVTGKKSTLAEVISIFKEQLDELDVITPEKALLRLRPYNFATCHSVDSRFLFKSTASEVAIISDVPEALYVARGLVAHGKRVTFISTRDKLANDELMLLAPEERDKITVTSIHKKYSIAMSDAEIGAVKFAQTFADSLRLALIEIAEQHLGEAVIDALCQGLEDYVYYEALRFYGCKICLDEYDKVLLLLKDVRINQDIPKSFFFHSKVKKQLGKVYIALIGGDTKAYLNTLETEVPLEFSRQLNTSQMKSDFAKFWWSLQDEKFDDYASMGKHIAICGNVSNENYAYSPASLKLVESIEKYSSLPILFFNSGLLPAIGQDEIKSITLSGNLSDRCTVYNGHLTRFRAKYQDETLLQYADLFQGPLYERLVALARQRLPEEFINIFKPRLVKYTDSLFAQIIFVAEATRTMGQSVLLATSMDRNHISRVLSAIAKSKKVHSFGIQPQIISASTRYRKPAVDVMGVIDTSQIETYKRLGASEGTLKAVGSVNIISRLINMDEATIAFKGPSTAKTIFFAMQHSNPVDMIETSIALKEICKRCGYKLLVKPHPHQELPILNEVRGLFDDASFVSVLGRNSDTYEAVARCSIVVGLFSSVLLESALYGKDVVVAAFRDIEESIDFSRLGLAVKARNSEQLDFLLSDLVEKGPISEKLYASRNQYLQLNPQFLPPYCNSVIEQFISEQLPSS